MKYETIIGYEVHVELATETKIFCGCSTKFGAPPNTETCPVCLGLPGSLPVLNRKAVDLAIRAALALHCDVAGLTAFERKNYYYPDLPKNYQISQLRQNLATGGYLDIPVAGGHKRILFNNIHLEEDAGKLMHPETPGADYSLVDLNRTGTVLLEIVSEPDLRSADEAMAFMQGLKNILEYIGVSDCNMHEGRLRFEVNISHRSEGQAELPDFRSEIKNLGSMKTAIKCIEYETKRQTRALDLGEPLARDTRLWDEEKQRTLQMRSKESAHDYRYFPEPDLVEIEISDEWIERVRATQPELPAAKKARFVSAYGLPGYDAEILTASRALADYYERAVRADGNKGSQAVRRLDDPRDQLRFKSISNWIMTALLRELNARGLEPAQSPVSPEDLAGLVWLIDHEVITGKIGKDVWAEMLLAADDPSMPKSPHKIVKAKGWVQVKDTGQVEAWVDEVVKANPGPAAEYASGKDKAVGFLVGQIMRLSKGKANPQLVNEVLAKKLRG
jgi:aspartyl-tRNA(Asn)/glutamyl-tRNA(Gln) amidotransferase subunit B